jgi:hypothetical protein
MRARLGKWGRIEAAYDHIPRTYKDRGNPRSVQLVTTRRMSRLPESA